MRLLRLAFFALVITSTAGGCATAGNGLPDGRSPDVLTRPELAEHPSYTAFEMVRQFRPIWLRARLGDVNVLEEQGRLRPTESGDPRVTIDLGSERKIRVYFDGVEQQEGLDALKMIETQDIQEMRKLDAAEATQRFGVGHGAGAIVIMTMRVVV